jgi:hypothetical protein
MTKRLYNEAFVRKSLSNHQSTCKECDPSFCTYSSHILHSSDKNPYLLETGSQFCESLFHIFPAPEFGLQEHGCISGEKKDNCRPQCLVLIAKFPGFLARYTNCRRTHAEQFMIHDPILHKALKLAKLGDELVMYMKFQPCNHSSGNARIHPEGYLFKNKMDSRSCTELVLKFYLETLKPLGIILTIKTASIYKANWEFSKRPDDVATTEKALEGVRILLKNNINLQSITPADWVFLASLSTNVNHLNLFSSARLKTDNGIAKFFEKTKLSIQ